MRITVLRMGDGSWGLGQGLLVSTPCSDTISGEVGGAQWAPNFVPSDFFWKETRAWTGQRRGTLSGPWLQKRADEKATMNWGWG